MTTLIIDKDGVYTDKMLIVSQDGKTTIQTNSVKLFKPSYIDPIKLSSESYLKYYAIRGEMTTALDLVDNLILAALRKSNTMSLTNLLNIGIDTGLVPKNRIDLILLGGEIDSDVITTVMVLEPNESPCLFKASTVKEKGWFFELGMEPLAFMGLTTNSDLYNQYHHDPAFVFEVNSRFPNAYTSAQYDKLEFATGKITTHQPSKEIKEIVDKLLAKGLGLVKEPTPAK